jgi:hypothetical protein
MVESFSFEEGALFGGQVLFQESEKGVHGRKRVFRILSSLFIVMLLIMLGVPFFIGADLLTALTYFFIFLLIIGLAILIGIRFSGIMSRLKLTPITIYKKGVSLGAGPNPFYRFSDIYYVEEYEIIESESRDILTEITFSDGQSRTLSIIIWPNMETFRKFQDTLVKQFFETKKGMPWEKEAEEFIAQLPHAKGPIRYEIEKSAGTHGEKKVSLRFIQSNWQEIAKKQKILFYDFKSMAKKKWGKST